MVTELAFFKTRSIFLVWSMMVVVALMAAFFVFSHKANAADAGEFVFFRVDTELDVPNAKDTSNKVTVRWYCEGGSGFGQVTDNTASESTDALDGIIKVASASKEMTDSGCTIGQSETLRASVSLDGWLEREWTAASFPGASTSVEFTQRASMDYTIVINGIDDELGTAITLNGTTASASYSGTVASQSYSGDKRYIAGSTSGGTVKGGANGYVNRTSAALTVSSTASQSVDFGVETVSSLNESGLDFGHKVRVYESGGSFAGNKFTTGTVTAGDSYGTTCTNNADGNWYCPVPIANTETSARFVLSGWVTSTATYTDRTAGSSASDSVDITPVSVTPSGGGGSTPTPSPTPTPAPSPTPTASVTPTPGVSPSPVPSATPSALQVTYTLYRKVSDPKVYVVGSDGTLRWVKTLADFNAAGYKWSDVKLISGSEFAKMRVGGKLRVAKGIKFLRVRDNSNLKGKILGQVLPGQELDFNATGNGWYKIKKDGKDWGWVFAGYVKEI